jgi:hypothetical protein
VKRTRCQCHDPAVSIEGGYGSEKTHVGEVGGIDNDGRGHQESSPVETSVRDGVLVGHSRGDDAGADFPQIRLDGVQGLDDHELSIALGGDVVVSGLGRVRLGLSKLSC